jgi:hypothetical protein
MMRNGGNTWAEHPKRDEYRAMNGGLGCCNTGAGTRGYCVLRGIGCDVDHVQIAKDNLEYLQARMEQEFGTS